MLLAPAGLRAGDAGGAERRAGLRARPALLPRGAGPGCLQVTANFTPHPSLTAFQMPKPKAFSPHEKPVRVGSKAEASLLQTLPALPAPGAGCRHRRHFPSRAPRGPSHVGGGSAAHPASAFSLVTVRWNGCPINKRGREVSTPSPNTKRVRNARFSLSLIGFFDQIKK